MQAQMTDVVKHRQLGAATCKDVKGPTSNMLALLIFLQLHSRHSSRCKHRAGCITFA